MRISRLFVLTLLLLNFNSACIDEDDPSSTIEGSEGVDPEIDINEDMLIIDSTGHTSPEDSLTISDSISKTR